MLTLSSDVGAICVGLKAIEQDEPSDAVYGTDFKSLLTGPLREIVTQNSTRVFEPRYKGFLENTLAGVGNKAWYGCLLPSSMVNPSSHEDTAEIAAVAAHKVASQKDIKGGSSNRKHACSV